MLFALSFFLLLVAPATVHAQAFDNRTNGHLTQEDFEAFRTIFGSVEQIEDGLGPVFNAQACRECHQQPVDGGSSQVTELRSGSRQQGQQTASGFVPTPGGSLIESRALAPEITEYVDAGDTVITFRLSLNTLGDGFIEAIPDAAIIAGQAAQPPAVRGKLNQAAILEGTGGTRPGRFGWKAQHSSLFSFSADAYLNEMGITSPLFAKENTSNGRDISSYDKVADPEDEGEDVEAFAEFIRASKFPPRGPATDASVAGAALFTSLGCAACHTPTFTTAPAGTVLNGGTFTVSAALGGKVIHPFSDFLLHNVGTRDGIDEPPGTANMTKTPPLWGLRTRNRLMHDGLSFTYLDAINRHKVQGGASSAAFAALPAAQQAELLAFLGSL